MPAPPAREPALLITLGRPHSVAIRCDERRVVLENEMRCRKSLRYTYLHGVRERAGRRRYSDWVKGVLLHGRQERSELAILQGLKVGAAVGHKFTKVYDKGNPVALSREQLGRVGGWGVRYGWEGRG